MGMSLPHNKTITNKNKSYGNDKTERRNACGNPTVSKAQATARG